MQQAKNLVSCVVERRKSDDASEDKDQAKNQKRNGERVSIICESNEPRRQEYVIYFTLGTIFFSFFLRNFSFFLRNFSFFFVN